MHRHSCSCQEQHAQGKHGTEPQLGVRGLGGLVGGGTFHSSSGMSSRGCWMASSNRERVRSTSPRLRSSSANRVQAPQWWGAHSRYLAYSLHSQPGSIVLLMSLKLCYFILSPESNNALGCLELSGFRKGLVEGPKAWHSQSRYMIALVIKHKSQSMQAQQSCMLNKPD